MTMPEFDKWGNYTCVGWDASAEPGPSLHTFSSTDCKLHRQNWAFSLFVHHHIH